MQNFNQLVLEFILLGYTGDYDNNKYAISIRDITNNIHQRSKIRELVSSFSGSYLIAPVDLEEITDINITVY